MVLRPRASPEPLPDGWHATAVRREAGMADSVVEAGAGGAFRVQLAAAPGGSVEVVFALLDPDDADGVDGPNTSITVKLITPFPCVVRSRPVMCALVGGFERGQGAVPQSPGRISPSQLGAALSLERPSPPSPSPVPS